MVDICEPSGALHSEQRDPAAPNDITNDRRYAAWTGDGVEPMVVGEPRPDHVPLLVEPRALTEADIPWLFTLCRKKYSHRYDALSTELWFRNHVLKTPLLYAPMRTDNAFCITMMTTTAWLPQEFEASICFICAEDNAGWEVMKLLRASVEWAKLRRCVAWRMATETDSDLTILARRLGATEISPRFTIRL